MKKSNEQVIIRNVLEYSLWTLLLLISVYITYCYSGNLLNNSHPAVITAIILFSVILGLLIIRKPQDVLLVSLILTHFAVLITWGTIVPYIQFMPLILTALFLLNKKEKLILPYLGVSALFTGIEFCGLLPLVKVEYLEVGLPNLTITFILQILTYSFWAIFLKFYALFDNINELGLKDLVTNTSKGFLASIWVKGLYVSMLLHFINNFFNSIVWGSKLSVKNASIIRLLAESDRADRNKSFKLSDIFTLLEIPKAKFPRMSQRLSTSDSKILFIILHNIIDNYKKHKPNPLFVVNVKENNILQIVIDTNTVTRTTKAFWNRNLGTTKHFLQLTDKGSLLIEQAPAFKTSLIYKLG